jgi:hypothetical protein
MFSIRALLFLLSIALVTRLISWSVRGGLLLVKTIACLPFQVARCFI